MATGVSTRRPSTNPGRRITRGTRGDKKLSLQVFAKVGDYFRPVVAQDDAGVKLGPAQLSWEEVWEGKPATASDPEAFFNWRDLGLPLPNFYIPCVGFGMTYPEHRREVKQSQVQVFTKMCSPRLIEGTFATDTDKGSLRTLDYEAELGLLLHRDTLRMGVVMLNDLTDRGLQVEHFHPGDPERTAQGFMIAKSFPGALQIGPLIAVGDRSAWLHEGLEIALDLNGVEKQRVRSKDCLLKPDDFARLAFDRYPDDEWVLAATGTAGGTLFKAPGTGRKILAVLEGLATLRTPKQVVLDRTDFLEKGHRVQMVSPLLGRANLTIA